MLAYVVRRLLMLPIIMIGVTIIVFMMMQLLGPDKMLAAYTNPNSFERFTIAELERLKDKHGLNDFVLVRYGKWLGNLLKGDLGYSQVGNDRVLKSILSRMPYSLELALYAIFPIIFGGIFFGIQSAVKHNRWQDHIIRIFTITGWSLPDFVFGILVLLVFYVGLGWFGPGIYSPEAADMVKSATYYRYTHFPTIDALLNFRLDIFWDAFTHLLGPIITLSWLWSAFLVRITRSSMLEVLKKDFIRTARSKGLNQSTVINVHARRNALIPVSTVVGQLILGLMMATIIVENIFNRPGFGSFIAQAAQQLDIASVMGGILVSSFMLIIGNLIIDISYGIIDPRIRLN